MTESIAQVRAVLAAEPATDAATLAEFVGGADSARAARCWDESVALVGTHLGSASVVDTVPVPVLARACLNVGSELYHAQDAPHGVANFSDELAPPVRVARDPLTSARPLLRPYLGGGFA